MLNNKGRCDLFIDESGSAYIGEPRYRFYVAAGIFIEPHERDLGNMLFKLWRRKYWKDENRPFHSFDFFEDYRKPADHRLTKQNLLINSHFFKATDELIEILSNVKFQACVYYVDLPLLRQRYHIPLFPEKRTRHQKKQYWLDIAKQTSGNPYLPINSTLKNIFVTHEQILSQKKCSGFINFESLAEQDTEALSYFHYHQNKLKKEYDIQKSKGLNPKNRNYLYGQHILGINLLTKNSLDCGIELAALIAYVTFQTLRGKYIKPELKELRKYRLLLIRSIQRTLRDKLNVRYHSSTDSTEIVETKKASMLLAYLGEILEHPQSGELK